MAPLAWPGDVAGLGPLGKLLSLFREARGLLGAVGDLAPFLRGIVPFPSIFDPGLVGLGDISPPLLPLPVERDRHRPDFEDLGEAGDLGDVDILGDAGDLILAVPLFDEGDFEEVDLLDLGLRGVGEAVLR